MTNRVLKSIAHTTASLLVLSCLSGCDKNKCRKGDEDCAHIPAPLLSKADMTAGNREQYNTHMKRHQGKRPLTQNMPSPVVERSVNEIRQPGSHIPYGGPIGAVSFAQMPLPTFIKTIFGDYLKADFTMDPAVVNRRELITLRSAGAKTPQELYKISAQVLKKYGLRVRYSGKLYTIEPDPQFSEKIPQVIRSRSVGDIPESLRPIFQIIDVKYVDKETVQGYLEQAYKDQVSSIDITADGNAVMVLGTPELVKSIIQAVDMFDRPAFMNRKSVRLNLTFLTADKMTDKLMEIMKAEGYSVGRDPAKDTAATIFIPVPSLNSILVFAPDRTIITHLEKWVKELDRPAISDPNGGLYYIPVRNTGAKEVGKVLNDVLSQMSVSTLGRSRFARRRTTNNGSGGKVVVDEKRNSLIFKGSAEQYGQILPLIQSMDTSVRDLLIEIVIAELRRSKGDHLGVNILAPFGGNFKTTDANGNLVSAGIRRLGAGTSFDVNGSSLSTGVFANAAGGAAGLAPGLNLAIMNTAAQRAATLNALATNTKSTVLSNPRLLVKSGSKAKYHIGQVVPFVTKKQQAPGSTSGTTAETNNIVSDIKREPIGVKVEVEPTIHAGRLIDLKITQEVSEVTKPSEGIAVADVITNKTELTTDLSLHDGSTALMGGFIKDAKTTGSSGVPILKEIPLLGNLFRSKSNTNEKVENILLITPYIIDNAEDAQAVTEAFQKRLSGWLKPSEENTVEMPSRRLRSSDAKKLI
jgi:general secretion pathway protein D